MALVKYYFYNSSQEKKNDFDLKLFSLSLDNKCLADTITKV